MAQSPETNFTKQHRSHRRARRSRRLSIQGLTDFMKPPHCCQRKCQKDSHSSSLCRPLVVVAPADSHQALIAKYRTSASSIDEAFLYCLHSTLCCSCKSPLMLALVCFSRDCVQWKRQILSRFSIRIAGPPPPYTIRTAFQFAWALSAMNPLN